MERILVIDDSPADRRLLRDSLESEGYDIDEAEGGQEALKHLFANRPDVVILDVVMPGMDGWTVCKRIREVTDVPIIMLTALDEDAEVVKGLELGADDFISKPFSQRQLIARVRAVLRRTQSPTVEEEGFKYDDGSLVIDVGQHLVLLDGELVELSPTEFRLLVALAESPGRVHEYGALLSRVWGPEYADEIDFLRVYVWRLRKKLEESQDSPSRILTERGFGYRFVRAG